MAFDRKKLSGNLGASSNAPKQFTFRDDASTKAQIIAADYFLEVYAHLEVGDFINYVGSDGAGIVNVATSTSAGVTVTAVAATV